MKLLVVDDDEITLELMVDSLSGYPGDEVASASNGETALERVTRGDIRLVISDWMMPGMSGVELCRQIRAAELPHHVYFILVSARQGISTLVEGLAAGADDYIAKPVQPAELTARVRSIQRLTRLHDKIRKQNVQLKANQKLKSDWTSMIVHDLRSPMAAILGFSNLLLRDVLPETRHWVETVQKEALRVNSMLEQMLMMAKSDNDELQLQTAPTDLVSIVEGARSCLMPVATTKNVAVDVFHEGSLLAEIDASLFRRAVDNLLANAIRFSPVDSVIDVDIRSTGPEAFISVADVGPGVPAEARDKIFNAYETLNLTHDGLSTSGRGLTFCRWVSDAHGGRISCKPNYPQGSRFEIQLPLERR